MLSALSVSTDLSIEGQRIGTNQLPSTTQICSALFLVLLLICGDALPAEAVPPRELTVVFAPRHRALLSAEVSARITSIHYEFGQTFKANDLLVSLDDTESKRSAEKAKSLLLVAEANLGATERLHETRSSIRRAEAEILLARANVTILEGIIKNETRRKKSMAEVQVAERILLTTEKLFQDNVASTLDLESAKKDLIISQANLILSDAAQEMELDTARKSLTDAESTLEISTASLLPELANARKDVAIAQSNLKTAEKELTNCTLLAPFDGRIKRLLVNNHELVQKGQNLLEIVSDSVLLAQFLVPSTEIISIRMGQQISILVIETGKPVTGIISHISATIDPASQSFMVYAEVNNVDQFLRSGMRGRLVFTSGKDN